MKKTIGILAIALLIGMALPALAQPPDGTTVAQGTGSAFTNGGFQAANTAAAGQGDETVAQADSAGIATNGLVFSTSTASGVPNGVSPAPEEDMNANTGTLAIGGPSSSDVAATTANGNAVTTDLPGTASVPGNSNPAPFTSASGTTTAGSNANGFAGPGSFTDISGDTYTCQQASVNVNSFGVGGSPVSISTNSAEATEQS